MIYFSSDSHVGHYNALHYDKSPFTTLEEKHTALINNFNSVITPEDEVYFLGDFSMSASHINFVQKFNGSFHLLCGNHDKAFQYRDGHKKQSLPQRCQAYLDAGFKSVTNGQIEMVIGNHTVILCHFPYQGDHYDSRYADYRPKNKGQWLIHGHVHINWLKKGKQINVGCPVWDYRPVSIAQIEQVMQDDRDFIKDWRDL